MISFTEPQKRDSFVKYGLGIQLTPEYELEWRALLMPIIDDMIRRKRQNPDEDVVTPLVAAIVKGVALSLRPDLRGISPDTTSIGDFTNG